MYFILRYLFVELRPMYLTNRFLCPIQGRRFSRPKKLVEYLDWVKSGASSMLHQSPAEPQTDRDRLMDTIMLRSRMIQGIDDDERMIT